MPKVSVIIPTYNRERFVIQAVDSVLRQTELDYEVIVVDDGSSDNTRAALSQYQDRISYVYHDNAGVSAARNTGVKRASGDWIAFLDSDDEWLPGYLATQMSHAREFPGAVAHITNAVHVFGDGEERSDHFSGINLREMFAGGSCVVLERAFCQLLDENRYWFLQSSVIRRDVLLEAGLFDEELSLAEDLDVIARVSLRGAFTFCKSALVKVWRRHEDIENLASQSNKGVRGYEAFAHVYTNLLRRRDLIHEERQKVKQVLGSNRRALGNLLVRLDRKAEARRIYRSAVAADPSLRAATKFLATFLPHRLCLLFIQKGNDYIDQEEQNRDAAID